MSLTFGWRSGARFGRLNAQAVGEELEKFRAKGHDLTPEYVVRRARAKRSPLHGAFIWDDAEAAHQHRLATARTLIRSIVVIPQEEGEVVRPRFVRVEPPEPSPSGEVLSVYRTAEEAMEDPILREQVLRRALMELRAFEKKYRRLAELARVFEAIDELAA